MLSCYPDSTRVLQLPGRVVNRRQRDIVGAGRNAPTLAPLIAGVNVTLKIQWQKQHAGKHSVYSSF